MAQYYQLRHHHHNPLISFATALVGLVGGFITLLLGTRFVLSLVGVDRLQPLVNQVYSLSYPFIAPFVGIFDYQPQFGVVRFELHTLVAIVFWAVATWLLARLISLPNDD